MPWMALGCHCILSGQLIRSRPAVFSLLPSAQLKMFVLRCPVFVQSGPKSACPESEGGSGAPGTRSTGLPLAGQRCDECAACPVDIRVLSRYLLNAPLRLVCPSFKETDAAVVKSPYGCVFAGSAHCSLPAPDLFMLLHPAAAADSGRCSLQARLRGLVEVAVTGCGVCVGAGSSAPLLHVLVGVDRHAFDVAVIFPCEQTSASGLQALRDAAVWRVCGYGNGCASSAPISRRREAP